MFIGHFAVGFAAKKFAPRSSLGVLLTAPMFLDLLWPVFVLLGLERVRIEPGNTRFTPLNFVYYPWSHSLLMAVAWATAFALSYQMIRGYGAGAFAIWIGVVSHWVLDWITHRPDMPLYPGGPRFGLGLWNSVTGTISVEIGMLAVGVWLYFLTTCALDRIGRYAFISYVALLFGLYLGNFASGSPPSVNAIASTGVIAALVLIPWAWWFDRHRILRETIR